MECYRHFFIQNNTLRPCREFNKSLVDSCLSIYEVIRLVQGVPLFLEQHIARLHQSAQLTGMKLSSEDFFSEKNIKRLKIANHTAEGNIRLLVCDGGGGGGRQQFFLHFVKHRYPEARQYQEGIAVELLLAERNNPNAKTVNNRLRGRANRIIAQSGVYEVLLVNQKGNITEGSRSNVFGVRENQLFTPPLDNILPGISRSTIIKIARNEGIIVNETSIAATELPHFDAVFLTGTSPKILPVRQAGTTRFETDNALMRHLMALYNKAIAEYVAERQQQTEG